ncbi:hypothetical protein [Glycomyces tenuis]|uniref:hypothetical protein n=1 Tax=Glycomyces tenuis TaxID=58116 RepID=UPI000415FDC6|nr:hypothetical protein [Glycomyces tenuis]
MNRRRFLACAIGAVLPPLAAGCDVTVSGGEDGFELPAAAEAVDGVEVWDLRERPTAAEVGIAGGDTAVFETRPSRPLELLLHGGARLRLPVRYIAFSAIGSADGSPVGVDLKTGTMPLEGTVDAYRSALEQLGLPTGGVEEFRVAAAEATGPERVESERVPGRFGELDLGVVARYGPRAQSGVVAVGGGWLGG